MNIQIEKVKLKDKGVLDNLLQLYLHDLSLYFPIEFDDEKGIYKYDNLSKYFNDSNNYAYFIKSSDCVAGFALIDANDNSFVVQEMFVLNNYKSKGIGKNAIETIFDKHRGKWIVKVVPNSPKAEKFWFKVISEYTNDKYFINHIGKYNRAEFSFNNKE